MNDFFRFFSRLFTNEHDKLANFDLTKLLVIMAILMVALVICIKITQKNKLYEKGIKKKEILHT